MKNTTKKKHFQKLTNAKLCFISRPNNTILSLTTPSGDVITQVSCGSSGFKNCKKSSPYALSTAINNMISRMVERHGVKSVAILIRGFNSSADLITNLQRNGILIVSIEYDTCIAYGGTRMSGARRT